MRLKGESKPTSSGPYHHLLSFLVGPCRCLWACSTNWRDALFSVDICESAIPRLLIIQSLCNIRLVEAGLATHSSRKAILCAIGPNGPKDLCSYGQMADTARWLTVIR